MRPPLSRFGKTYAKATIAAFMLGLTPFVVSPSAMAQDPVLDKLLACDSIKKRTARKNCINAVIKELRQVRKRKSGTYLEGSPAPTAADNDQTYTHEKGGEGFYVEKDSRKKFSAGLRKFYKDPRGTFYFFLDNGQIWRETKGGLIHHVSKHTKQVTIKRGLIGGWRITFDTDNQLGNVERIR